MLSNADLANLSLEVLQKTGVKTVCICPGARNSPLVEVLSEGHAFEKLYFFDERSAGFFALGRMQLQEKPVAVITTSGTAAGELLPPVMEACYSGLPLLVITADRPRRYRGTGAPQTAEQPGIFGVYSHPTVDWACSDEKFEFGYDDCQPMHLNVCFEEPLVDQSKTPDVKPIINTVTKKSAGDGRKIKAFLEGHRSTLAIVSGLTLGESTVVKKFLEKSNLPFYAEGTSQLRECGMPQQIFVADGILQHFNSVLRIGSVPTHRLWRDLEAKHKLPTLSVSSKRFSGLPGGDLVYGDLSNLFDFDYSAKENFTLGSTTKLAELFEQYPLSEPAQVHFLSHVIKDGSRVYLGNSLPIRQWDLAATLQKKNFKIEASRGLNGIDGQLSCFLGGVSPDRNSVAVVGDLTALYDLQAPWILKQLGEPHFKIVIINNGGGKIFKRMFDKKDYLNEHGLNFNDWAKMWNLSYEFVSDIRKLKTDPQVIELKPDEQSTQKFWDHY